MKKKLLKFITSLTQDSNFGGIREGEHWISHDDVFPKLKQIQEFYDTFHDQLNYNALKGEKLRLRRINVN